MFRGIRVGRAPTPPPKPAGRWLDRIEAAAFIALAAVIGAYAIWRATR